MRIPTGLLAKQGTFAPFAKVDASEARYERRRVCPFSCFALLVLLAALAGPGATSAQEVDLGTPAQREAGRVLYNEFCSQCHGENGDGQGYATPYLNPQPRDFTLGVYKIRATPSGALPTDEDMHKQIRQGMPYTSMIGWPDFSDEEVTNIIYHLKTFTANFEDLYYYDPPIDIADPPAYTAASVELGREVYFRMECNKCHGEEGRGDGGSTPTLKDDAGNSIRSVDMTKRWVYRGGPTREDIYRTFSTGMNGTPMPSYDESLKEDERWQLVDFIYSLGESDEPNYSDRLFAASIEDDIDMAQGEALFEQAQSAYFPLVGQIMEPGRAFHPAANGIEVKAVHNGREIAFLVKWNDMRADISGTNSPALELPAEFGEGGLLDEGGASEDQESAEAYFFGEADDEEEESDDFFFGTEDDEEAGGAIEESAFSDAVAIQFPSAPPQGIRLPHFIFGDLANPVDIWFADLAQDQAQRFVGRGSQSVTENDVEGLVMDATYENGEWRVIFKQPLRSDAGLSFEEEQWVPVAFSVWDGWNQERGNNRALTSWFYLYVEPQQTPSRVFPMARAALVALVMELALVAWVRRKYRLDPSMLEAGE